MIKPITYNIRKFIRGYNEYPLLEIKDRISNQPSKNNIPSTVFQTWDTRFLEKNTLNKLKISDIYPSLSFYLYDKEQRDDYMQPQWGKNNISKIYVNVHYVNNVEKNN